MDRWKNFRYLLYLLALIGSCFVFLSYRFTRNNGVTEEENFVEYETRTILTDSMDPTLPVGSKVSVNKSETPKIGDMIQFRCVAFKCGNRRELPTVHRWVSTDPDGCMRIIGDNPKIDWSNEICFYPNEISIEGVVHKL